MQNERDHRRTDRSRCRETATLARSMSSFANSNDPIAANCEGILAQTNIVAAESLPTHRIQAITQYVAPAFAFL